MESYFHIMTVFIDNYKKNKIIFTFLFYLDLLKIKLIIL